jgi:thiosulfate/3-mercaptopyruvate sulfurtransferase
MKAGWLFWKVIVLAAGLGGLGGCRRVSVGTAAGDSGVAVARPEVLVTPGWVRAAMEYRDGGYRGERPAGWGRDRLVVVEAAWLRPGETEDYERGRVPGALLVNTEDLEDGFPTWRLRPVGELQAVLGRAGITPESTVVVYGRSVIAAARVWWILGYAGVADVRLMDGGFDGWRAAGYAVGTGRSLVEAVAFAAAPRAHWLATTDEVKPRVAAADGWLGDVRSVEEFAGRTSGYSYLDAHGRLPGAIHLGDADDASPLCATRDGRLRPAGEVLALWQRQGLAVRDDGRGFRKDVIFYCGGGWRSSLAFFHAWRLGLDNVRNYSDGWAGWSTRYEADAAVGGSTPGWRQVPTGSPVEFPGERPAPAGPGG